MMQTDIWCLMQSGAGYVAKVNNNIQASESGSSSSPSPSPASSPSYSPSPYYSPSSPSYSPSPSSQGALALFELQLMLVWDT